MALVVLLRGMNVGGHRRFRPSALAGKLKHLDAVSIGATGTFVIQRPVSRQQLRAELSRLLPFDAEIVICDGRDMLGLLLNDPFRGRRIRSGEVRFVSVLAKRPHTSPSMPIVFPRRGRWLLKIFGRAHRFVFGVYRRDMKVIGYLGALDRIFGVPVTTRNWNTIGAISRELRPQRAR